MDEENIDFLKEKVKEFNEESVISDIILLGEDGKVRRFRISKA